MTGKKAERKAFTDKRIWAFVRMYIKKDQFLLQELKYLYPRENHEELLLAVWKKRIVCIGILILLAGVLLIYCARDKPVNMPLKENSYVERGDEDHNVDVLVTGNDGTDIWKKKMTVPVKQRKLSAEEKAQMEQLTSVYLEEHYLGNNESAEHVSKPLFFAKSIPDTEIELSWSYEETYLRDTGELRSDKIPEEGVNTNLMVEAVCRNWKKTFYYSIHLESVCMSKQEKEIYDVKQALKKTMQESKTEQVVELPAQVGETSLTYENIEKPKNFMPFYVILVILVSLPFVWREQQKKAKEKRENQMMTDHPEILNKVMLLLGAGLTFRGTIERLAAEYERERASGGPFRYAYEELCIMVQEMKDGVSEVTAIERFGRRCRMLPYLKFSSIITQNLKKGASGMIEILEKEAGEALVQRKERALKQGETAGTKLLMPMMLMLGLVMGIIMIPAFMSM